LGTAFPCKIVEGRFVHATPARNPIVPKGNVDDYIEGGGGWGVETATAIAKRAGYNFYQREERTSHEPACTNNKVKAHPRQRR